MEGEVQDLPDAKPLPPIEGKVELEDVYEGESRLCKGGQVECALETTRGELRGLSIILWEPSTK